MRESFFSILLDSSLPLLHLFYNTVLMNMIYPFRRDGKTTNQERKEVSIKRKGKRLSAKIAISNLER